MKIIYWGKGLRGFKCFQKILEKKYEIVLVVGHENDNENADSIITLAQKHNIETAKPEDPNSDEFENFLKAKDADVFILGGYGKIIKQNIIDIPKVMCLNLHGGKLPDMRGSSPLNWAIIKNKKSFGLSIIKINAGIDTGDIIYEKSIPIESAYTIVDLHNIANEAFPEMLVEVLEQIKNNTYTIKNQDKDAGAYYPLRSPEDGFILFDQFTASDIHNKIRALTRPYPCAFTFYKGKKILLLESALNTPPYYGEPGKIYRISKAGLLVCAMDECLLIKKAVFEENDEDIKLSVKRYDELLTVRNYILINLKNQ